MPQRSHNQPTTHAEVHARQGSARGTYLANFILGANDGLVTTFAVVAGASGAHLSGVFVIIFGLANLLADGLSMGLGNYLGQRSTVDYHQRQRESEHAGVETFPTHETQEVREVFQRWGFSGAQLEAATATITSDKKRWVDFMMREELAIIEEPSVNAAQQGLVTFAAFVTIGVIPLVPYGIGLNGTQALWGSVVLTASGLFAVGAARSLVTVQRWYRGGMQMLAVGGTAAAVAYAVGYLVERFVA